MLKNSGLLSLAFPSGRTKEATLLNSSLLGVATGFIHY